MCSAGFQGVVHSRQVHPLKQGTHIGCSLPTLFNITDIINSKLNDILKPLGGF